MIIGDSNLFAQHRLSLLQLSKQFYKEYNSYIAYLDSSSAQQTNFHDIVSNFYKKNEQKLLVSRKNLFQLKERHDFLNLYSKILVARRSFQDSIEILNTDIEFDKKSLNEIERNLNAIKENLQLFISSRWQYAKKYKLPQLIDFDQRHQVNSFLQKSFFSYRNFHSFQNFFRTILDRFENKWNYWVERNRILRYL